MRFKRVASRLPDILSAEIKRRLDLRQSGAPGMARQHSIRAIAKETNVDRETVQAIDRGAYEKQTSFRHCSACGYSVLAPCRICAARAERLRMLARAIAPPLACAAA